MGCDLEVDVNGEQVFMVDKKFFSSFSSRLSRVFGRGGTRNLKVIFHNFPGGAEGFELMARFCYNNGTIVITPSNVVLLNYAARFMEMNGDTNITHSLVTQTEKFLGGISHLTWSELLEALKQCQVLLPTANSSSITKRVLDCLVKKLVLPNIASPFASSSYTSSVQFSCDTESIDLMKNNLSQTAWWFDHLMFLSTDFIQKVVRTMISQEVDHATVSKFLFYYQKLKSFGATPVEKRRLTEVITSLLYFLDRSSVSLKGLFNIYQVALSTRVGTKYRNKLESLIGSQLDEATINYLLVPSSAGKSYSYDVNMVKRLVKAFLVEGGFHLLPSKLNKVSMLMDLYLVEVAPDSHLNPSKFLALTMLLPDCARETHDRLYGAIDIYLQVHAEILSEEAKVSICSALNLEKISAEALKHLTRNSKFPPRTLMKAFIAKDSKLRKLLHEIYHLKTISSTDSLTMETKGGKELGGKQILLHAKKTIKFSEDLQEMDWKAMELEKVCGVLQSRTADIVKPGISITGHARYLPKICSK